MDDKFEFSKRVDEDDSFYFKPSNSYEKLVLTLTYGFNHLLSLMIPTGYVPFCKIDIAVSDKISTKLFSYNNGMEVNYYEVSPDSVPYFIYAPNTDEYHHLYNSNLKFSQQNPDLEKNLKVLYKKWSSETESDYPRDILSNLEKIYGFDEQEIYAVLIGYKSHWNSIRPLFELFEVYIDHWNKSPLAKESRLKSLVKRKQIMEHLAFNSIIREACENILYTRFYKNKSSRYLKDSPFDVVCNLACMPYEGSTNKGVIEICEKNSSYTTDVLFKTPIPFDLKHSRVLRKILEMTNKQIVLMVSNGYAVGLSKETNTYSKLEFKGNGKWKLYSKTTPLLTVNGSSCLLSPSLNTETIKETYLSCFEHNTASETVIENIVESAKDQSHGTSIVIIPSAEKEANRLCDLDRGIKITPIDLSEDQPLTLALTAIDGAILLDPNGRCYAIGVILDGDAVISGNAARGARYNSLRNYIERLYDKEKILGMAIILSEDRTLDIWPSKKRLLDIKRNSYSNAIVSASKKISSPESFV